MAIAKRSIVQYAFLFLMFVVLPAGSYYYLNKGHERYLENKAAMTPKGDVPDFQLINQKGDTITRADFEGAYWVASFFFTRCGTTCPTVNSKLALFQEKFEDQPSVRILSVTVDPKHDSSAVLLDYANALDAEYPKWTFATGSATEIYSLAREGFSLVADDGGSNQLQHSNKVVLVDDSLRIRGYYDALDKASMGKLVEHTAILMPKDGVSKYQVDKTTENK